MVLALAWASPGLVSSNDGSHLALARALVLRGETTLGDEVALTLWVDRSRRDGHDHSDRPPGTALLAAPAVRLGAWLDPALLQTSLDTKEIVVQPAAPRYAETYVARVQRLGRRAPPLLALQGTALALALHCASVAALGLLGVLVLLRRRGASPAAQAFAGLALGIGCLWGPYSTVLFSHVTAGTCVVWAVLGLELGLGLGPSEPHADPVPRRLPLVLAGLAAGWAASADYLVGLLVFGVGLSAVPVRRWLAALPWVLLGALPIVGATLAYHDAAFGSPWSLGYDHHANFEFARERASTFGGNPLHGLWVQWGAGAGAGVLVLSPVMLVGAVGLAVSRERRWLLGALPWILLLAAHRTPAGGAAEDHRYLLPLMPLLAVGLGRAWSRWAEGTGRARLVAAGLVLLAASSGAFAWSHVLAVWG
ncbi:hypothetical protein [Paraliomyxa miuraensis]|uniref:hypothetical protein n=1 Tax=Paraliomyxa miuraensis TaxID=376150 RepID=UPI00225372FE|nr:hypothetical protein [Paraliomyxa miuraensis]MCX4242600.1 hypothetical protein [Paraliomyxa miuraensis]